MPRKPYRRGGKGALRPARTTGRIPRKAPNGTRQAESFVARLDEPAFRARAQLTEAEMVILDRICSGRPPRNAGAIMKGIEFRASYAYAKPKQEHEHSGAVTITKIERVIIDAAKP